MRKFESSQKDESRDQSADSSKSYRNPRVFICRFVYSSEIHKEHQCIKLHGFAISDTIYNKQKGSSISRHASQVLSIVW